MTPFDINHDAMLVRTPAEARVVDLEAHLAGSGYTLGVFHAPVGTDPAFTIADWLADPLIPPCNWAGGTLLERIVSVIAEGRQGRLVTNIAPRSATGSDINYAVAGGGLAAIRELLLRVKILSRRVEIQHWTFASIGQTAGALAALAHRKVVLESVHVLVRDGGRQKMLTVAVGIDDALGTARAAYTARLLAGAGGIRTPYEVKPGQSTVTSRVELFAPYGLAGAFDALVGECGGLVLGMLHRYSTEGVSFRMVFKGPDKDLTHATATRLGLSVVTGGGAFLTNGSSPAVEGILKRLKEGLA